MSTIFTSTIHNTLSKTVKNVIDDTLISGVGGLVFPKWMDQSTTEDAYFDDQEFAGPGYANERSEGEVIPVVSMQEGYTYRYIARNFALRMIITEEAIDDSKMPQVIKLAPRLADALYMTAEVDAHLLLSRGFDTSYVFGDGQPLFSASHPLPGGGTFNNILAAASPSRAAVIDLVSMLSTMTGHNGTIRPLKAETIIHHSNAWAQWEELINSAYAPEAGEYNRINVVNKMGLEHVSSAFLFHSTTNWFCRTNATSGPKFVWRKKPSSRDWVSEENMSINHAISARWSRGISDPRCLIGNAA